MKDDEFGAVVYHGPPRTRYDDTGPAIAEGAESVDAILGLARPSFLATADWNSGSIQHRLARTHQARVVGGYIDAAVAAGMDVIEWEYVTHVGGVPLRSDHRWGALRMVVHRKGRRLARKRVVWFYNIEVGRTNAAVSGEIAAMLRQRRTFAVFLVEASGYDLPRVKRFELVRDRTPVSRANVAAYVRRGHLRDHAWVDLKKTWKRTEYAGQHDPRSYLVLLIGWTK